ncbi:helix-turn-helix domain-containing protein [Actinoallomurus sp. NPDC052308]|uniref:helix-turn-helix domain-containing protein n=1 Tax=Actinoallomurus sp. NPDC052308 TaxID=3155530 RepID=UPI00344AE480
MQLRYAYRLYPTPEQRIALAQAFGCARVVFNDGLRAPTGRSRCRPALYLRWGVVQASHHRGEEDARAGMAG